MNEIQHNFNAVEFIFGTKCKENTIILSPKLTNNNDYAFSKDLFILFKNVLLKQNYPLPSSTVKIHLENQSVEGENIPIISLKIRKNIFPVPVEFTLNPEEEKLVCLSLNRAELNKRVTLTITTDIVIFRTNLIIVSHVWPFQHINDLVFDNLYNPYYALPDKTFIKDYNFKLRSQDSSIQMNFGALCPMNGIIYTSKGLTCYKEHAFSEKIYLLIKNIGSNQPNPSISKNIKIEFFIDKIYDTSILININDKDTFFSPYECTLEYLEEKLIVLEPKKKTINKKISMIITSLDEKLMETVLKIVSKKWLDTHRNKSQPIKGIVNPYSILPERIPLIPLDFFTLNEEQFIIQDDPKENVGSIKHLNHVQNLPLAPKKNIPDYHYHPY